MTQTLIKLDENQDRVLNVVKGKFGFKNKNEAIMHIIKEYEEEFLEPELRPEYLQKLRKIEEEGYGETFNSIEQLRKKIEKR